MAFFSNIDKAHLDCLFNILRPNCKDGTIDGVGSGIDDGAIGRINNPLLHMPLKNSLDMITGAGSVTFTRASTATYIDRYGVLQYAAVDEPRFEKEGLLMEGANTNIADHSEDLSDANGWAQIGSNVNTPNTTDISDPAGNNKAVKIVSGGADRRFLIKQYLGSVSTDPFTLSFWFTPAAGYPLTDDGLKITYREGTTVIGQTAPQVVDSAGIFKRYEFTITGHPAIADLRFDLNFGPDNGASPPASGSTVFFAFPQIEQFPFATSYIPTGAAAATRAIELCLVSFAGNMPAPNTEEMSLLVDFDVIGNTHNQIVFHNYPEAVRAIQKLDNDLRVFYGGAAPDMIEIINLDYSVLKRYGYVYDLTDLRFYVDGVLSGTKPIPNAVTGITPDFSLGCFKVAGFELYGHLSNFRIYDIGLTETEMKIA